MRYLINISENKLSYDYFEDVLNFHINNRKNVKICYLNPHKFIDMYAKSYGYDLMQVSFVDNKMYVLLFGKNSEIFDKCKNCKLNYKFLEELKC